MPRRETGGGFYALYYSGTGASDGDCRDGGWLGRVSEKMRGTCQNKSHEQMVLLRPAEDCQIGWIQFGGNRAWEVSQDSLPGRECGGIRRYILGSAGVNTAQKCGRLKPPGPLNHPLPNHKIWYICLQSGVRKIKCRLPGGGRAEREAYGRWLCAGLETRAQHEPTYNERHFADHWQAGRLEFPQRGKASAQPVGRSRN